MIERIFILKRTEIFGELSHEILGSLAAHLEEVQLEPGETLFQKGDLGHAMYVLVEGHIRVHDGDRTLAELAADSVFGEVTALTSEVRSATATALEECRLLRLDQDVLYELMAGRPSISQALIKVLVERLG
jgi:CRP/FNR family transcriptional regulator, cyclic AMP receptor protein